MPAEQREFIRDVLSGFIAQAECAKILLEDLGALELKAWAFDETNDPTGYLLSLLAITILSFALTKVTMVLSISLTENSLVSFVSRSAV
jgi:hypothetical protein